MEKSKVFFGVLAAGLAVSLVGNVYLWNSLNQKDTEYIAAMANLEEEFAQNKEAQDTLRQQLEQTKADLEQAESQPKGEVPKEEGGNPLEGMTPEEIDAWMRDTSDAPKPGDLPQQPESNQGQNQGGNQGNQGNQGNTGNTGNTGNKGNTGGSALTPEEQAELQRILDGLSSASRDDSRYHEGGTGSQGGPGSINWNK